MGGKKKNTTKQKRQNKNCASQEGKGQDFHLPPWAWLSSLALSRTSDENYGEQNTSPCFHSLHLFGLYWTSHTTHTRWIALPGATILNVDPTCLIIEINISAISNYILHLRETCWGHGETIDLIRLLKCDTSIIYSITALKKCLFLYNKSSCSTAI